MKTLRLEIVTNGETLKSAIADNGEIYATGTTSREILREAGFAARRDRYDSIAIGAQNWEVERLVELN